MIAIDRNSLFAAGIMDNRQTAAAASVTPKYSFAEQLASVENKGRELDEIFEKASRAYGVPSSLLRAIAFHESGFQEQAVSSAGAMGLMQLMPDTAKAMGVANAFDPEQNVMGGAKLLGQYLNQYSGDLKLTLAAYGAGSGAVAKYNGVPPYGETQKFVEDIMSVTLDADSPAQAVPDASDPVFQEYPDLYHAMDQFEGYSQRDYSVFLSWWLTKNQGAGIFDMDEERQDSIASPLFYLG